MLAPIKVTSDQVSSHYAVRRHQISVKQAVRWKCYCVCVCVYIYNLVFGQRIYDCLYS